MARFVPAIGSTVGTEPRLEQAMGSHAVRLVHSKFMEQKMLETSIFCPTLAVQNSHCMRLATQALHMKCALVVCQAPAHVELELALHTFESAIQRMPCVPGHFGDYKVFRKKGLLKGKSPNTMIFSSVGQVGQHISSLSNTAEASDVDSCRVLRARGEI